MFTDNNSDTNGDDDTPPTICNYTGSLALVPNGPKRKCVHTMKVTVMYQI